MSRLTVIACVSVFLQLSACSSDDLGNSVMLEQNRYAIETEATRAVAHQFLERAFLEKDFRGAYDTYAHPNFIQHNPKMGNGLAAHKAYFDEMAKTLGDTAGWAHVTDMVLVDGNLFAVLHHVYRSPDDNGQIVADIWRVENGKIAEHWDVIQQMPASMRHHNGMGCGHANDWVSAQTHKDSVHLPTCGRPNPKANRQASIKAYEDYVSDVARGDIENALNHWLSEDYRQHSPNIGEGKQGAIDHLRKEWGDRAAVKPVLGPQRIVAEGDLVLVHFIRSDPVTNTHLAQVDIFRISGGKISEHWDVKQPVPPTTVSGNHMW